MEAVRNNAHAAFTTSKRVVMFPKRKATHYLHPAMREFISRRHMVFIATADARGHADSSVRFGPLGFVQTLDENTILYPEYRGGESLASADNILENPYVGMLFIDSFQHGLELHVNGRAKVVENAELLNSLADGTAHEILETPLSAQNYSAEMLEPLVQATLTINKPRVERWIVVKVTGAYIHRAKHVPLFRKGKRKDIPRGTVEQNFTGSGRLTASALPTTLG
ncbi:pyridoxamine 5'-phosphate oxidase family protein [Mycobacterium spongiae]|uniref:Pyridoxamine 5-phosphate oxidase n=1 Tax=Mycobacterium spongiae TaxID=886343 RepID=A0A975PYN1_9MYCO|nr:pyridoxamine 5'-phosphate oxidase family protein [Mycobacterium spongiae]QUR69312.1 pyridoxamine 5-phosphate oxidase [Mycobacterium spongiae]